MSEHRRRRPTVLSQSFFLTRVRNVETGTPVFTYYGQHEHRPRRTDARERRPQARRRQLRGPRAHRDHVRLEPGPGAVHRDTGRGSSQPASRKRGVRMMRYLDRSTRDERGNMIVDRRGDHDPRCSSSVAVVARTIAGLTSTRQGQDFSAALANADAGVSDALFRIDQLGTAPAATFCVGTNAACTVASVPGAPGVQYTARRGRRQHLHGACRRASSTASRTRSRRP